jgi:2-dehydropantoate 2-reductase
MRFVVLGAGAIGAYVGAALVRGGADVTLIARGPHLRAMQEHGVQVRSPRGDFDVHPPVTEAIEAIGDADVVFLALKAHSLPALAERIGGALGRDTAVVAAQNGIPWWYTHAAGNAPAGVRLESVDPGGRLANAIDVSRVVGCVVYCSTEVVEPGVIRHIEGTRFAIGEPDGTRSERCRQISEAFAAGGLRAPVDADLRTQIWLKLIGNVAFNPASALTGATLAQLGSTAEMVAALRAVLEEGAAVAAALGVELPVSIDRRLEAGFAVGDHKTSMLQDLEAGRQLEVGCLTGAVVELAEHLGVPVPAMRVLDACTKLLDARRVPEHVGAAA